MSKPWTGERLETFVYKDTATQHLHRYAIAIDFIKNKKVLDIASGEGYGSNFLAKYANHVVGVDIDQVVVKAAKEKYIAENLEFKVGRADEIPLESNSIDIVISFETLEHHDMHHEMMNEIKRVLKNDGILIMSTPEKKEYSDNGNHKNPYHVKELYFNEFQDLIKGYFGNTFFLFQNIFKGSLIIPEHGSLRYKRFGGDYSRIESGDYYKPKYVIAIASDEKLYAYNYISGFDGKNISIIEKQELLEENRILVREESIHWVKNSWSFLIGEFFVAPLRAFKNFINFNK